MLAQKKQNFLSMKIISLQDSRNLAKGMAPQDQFRGFNQAQTVQKKSYSSSENQFEISQKNLTKIPKDKDFIRSYFLKLLAARDYSEAELRTKAKQKEFDPAIVEEVIEEFKSKKWLDDERFAQNLFEIYKGQKGENWISQKLQQKGISRHTIQAIFESQSQIQPAQNVKELLERKHKITDWKNIDIKVQNKVIYLLCSRGFRNPFEILKQWKSQ
jgi:regulatory protein